MPMKPLRRDRPGVPIYLIPTGVRCAKIPTDKVSPLTSANLAKTAAVACRRLLLMIAVRQIILRPRPRGLDLLSRCGACLMQARLKNKQNLSLVLCHCGSDCGPELALFRNLRFFVFIFGSTILDRCGYLVSAILDRRGSVYRRGSGTVGTVGTQGAAFMWSQSLNWVVTLGKRIDLICVQQH